MKKFILTALGALTLMVSINSCKKENKMVIIPTTFSENLYDTTATKRFIDIYVTNTNGSTFIFKNNTLIVSTNGSTVRAFNANNGDTIKVECRQPILAYNKINIRKNYTSVVDTSSNSSTYFRATFIVR